MALPKLFNLITWHNNTTPAINEDNLNAMSQAIDDIDDRVIGLAGTIMEDVPQIQEDIEELEADMALIDTKIASATAEANRATTAANNAAASVISAGNKALVSEGWAKGTQNGAAVGSSSPYYHNNAEYFKNQARSFTPQGYQDLVDDVDSLKETFTKNGAHNLLTYPFVTTGGTLGDTATYIVNNDGTITVNGTTTNNEPVNLHYRANVVVDNNPVILPKGDYIVSCPQRIRIDLYRTVNGSINTICYLASTDSENSFSLTEETQIGVMMTVIGGTAYSNEKVEIMIRLATDTDTTYTPYAKTNLELTQNKADWDSNAVLGAHQLLNIDNQRSIGSDVTITKTSTGINVAATTGINQAYTAWLTNLIPNKMYEVSCDVTVTSGNSKLLVNNGSTQLIFIDNVSGHVERTFTAPSDVSNLFIAFFCTGDTSETGDVTFDNLLLKLIEDNSNKVTPYAMTNRELTNVVQAEARISAISSAWQGNTLTFKGLPKSNTAWYEFSACVATNESYFYKGYIILRENGDIYVNGKIGGDEYTVAYNQDGDLVITLPVTAYWLYDMRRISGLK